MKKNNGITLIALMITIVVLIILAGVAINLTLGDNGIFNKAKKAKEDYQTAATNEQGALNGIDIDSMTGGNTQNTEPYANPYIPTGFTHTEGTWNSGYTIKGTTQSTDNEFVWVPCVLTQTAQSTADGVVTFEKITTGKYNEYSLGLLPTDTTVVAEDSSVAEIRTSVGKYGGFYIAKYEAGVPGTTESTTTTDGKTTVDGNVKPTSQAGVGVWNQITRTNAITVSKAMIDKTATGVSSTLISGEAWDTTLAWVTKTNSTYAEDSTGKGWYSDVSSSKPHTTGFYAVNNIYDMAGNVLDWTTENCAGAGDSYFVYRGGYYDRSGSGYTAAYRGNNNGYASYYTGFRAVLYK